MAITYPVDVANTRWSVYRVSTGEIVKHNTRWPRADGGAIVGQDPDLVPLREVEAAQPAYNPATHKLERAEAVTDVAANTHTHGWNVVALSAAELADLAETAQAKANYQLLLAGSGTQLERLVRVERVCAHLLKLQYGPQ
jgi:hypothetical protein